MCELGPRARLCGVTREGEGGNFPAPVVAGGRGDSPERQFVRLAAALHPKILILEPFTQENTVILALHPTY